MDNYSDEKRFKTLVTRITPKIRQIYSELNTALMINTENDANDIFQNFINNFSGKKRINKTLKNFSSPSSFRENFNQTVQICFKNFNNYSNMNEVIINEAIKIAEAEQFIRDIYYYLTRKYLNLPKFFIDKFGVDIRSMPKVRSFLLITPEQKNDDIYDNNLANIINLVISIYNNIKTDFDIDQAYFEQAITTVILNNKQDYIQDIALAMYFFITALKDIPYKNPALIYRNTIFIIPEISNSLKQLTKPQQEQIGLIIDSLLEDIKQDPRRFSVFKDSKAPHEQKDFPFNLIAERLADLLPAPSSNAKTNLIKTIITKTKAIVSESTTSEYLISPTGNHSQQHTSYFKELIVKVFKQLANALKKLFFPYQYTIDKISNLLESLTQKVIAVKPLEDAQAKLAQITSEVAIFKMTYRRIEQSNHISKITLKAIGKLAINIMKSDKLPNLAPGSNQLPKFLGSPVSSRSEFSLATSNLVQNHSIDNLIKLIADNWYILNCSKTMKSTNTLTASCQQALANLSKELSSMRQHLQTMDIKNIIDISKALINPVIRAQLDFKPLEQLRQLDMAQQADSQPGFSKAN